MKDIEGDEQNLYLKDLENSDEIMKNLLIKMLEMNPYFRSSAREILKSTLFDDIRIHANER